MKLRIVLLIALAMALSLTSLTFASSANAQASPVTPPACPDGYTLNAGQNTCSKVEASTLTEPACPDGTLGTPGGCYVEVEQTEVPSCAQGDLVDDTCRVVGPGPTGGPGTCPDGYSPNDSLGGICARFELASQLPPSCPSGSQGVAGACYILVASGPPYLNCTDGEQAGENCVITGEPPVAGPSTCPISVVVMEDGELCFRIVRDTDLTQDDEVIDCEERIDGVFCRVTVEKRPGPLLCADGYGIVDGECLRYVPAETMPGECPAGSVRDDDNNCRKPVADARGAYYCEDETAALNGASCVFTASFLPLSCTTSLELEGDECVRYNEADLVLACPSRSEAAPTGECRQPVADAPQRLHCVDDTAELAGDTCTVTVDAAACDLPLPPWFDPADTLDCNRPPSISDPVAVVFEAPAGKDDLIPPAVSDPDEADTSAAAAARRAQPALVVTNDAPDNFSLGTFTVTWTVTDPQGLSATAAQLVTVQDTTAPVVTVPETIRVTSEGAAMPVSFVATAIDSYEGPIDPTCDIESGSSLPLGTTSVTCTALDTSGNLGTATFDIMVLVITGPASSSAASSAYPGPFDIALSDQTAASTVAPAPPLASHGTTPELAFTGVESALLAQIALAMIGVGSLGLATRRRLGVNFDGDAVVV